jgi:hypothetical protein
VSAAVSTRCSVCGKDLTDKLSRRYGIGPDCRAKMTSAELADAIRRNQPGFIRRTQPVSVQARINRANALAAVGEVVECGCGSGAQAGRCPECLAEQRDPMGVLAKRVQRVIERVRIRRAAERDARYEAWLAAHPPEPEQLDLTDCHPREEAS